MNPEGRIHITMPDLSPEAAQALCDWVSELAYEVERYYTPQLIAFEQQKEETEYLRPQDLKRQQEDSEWEDDLDF